MKDKIVFPAAILSVCAFIGATVYSSRPASGSFCGSAETEIRRSIFNVEVADSEIEREKGLSGRETLPENEGMLFVFREPSITAFWTKGMRFPIDIIWIREGEIIGFIENAKPEPGTPDGSLTVYIPPGEIDMALEVYAGTVSAKKLRVGDGVFLRNMVELHIIGKELSQ